MVIMISSLTRRSKRPRSGRLRVTWRMISSKHWEKSSSRTGQIPLSLAWRSISFWSSISLRRATSILEAGWWLTYWIQCLPVKIGGNDVSSRHKIQISGQLQYWRFDHSHWIAKRLDYSHWGLWQIDHLRSLSRVYDVHHLPFSTHSLGGRIALRMSSCLGLFSIGGRVPFLLDAANSEVNRSVSGIQSPIWLLANTSKLIARVCLRWVSKLTSEGLPERITWVSARADLYK